MKKFFAYIFIAITLTGIFSIPGNVTAQATSLPACTFSGNVQLESTTVTNGPAGTNCRLPTCVTMPGGGISNGRVGVTCATSTREGGAADQPTAGASAPSDSAFENELSCNILEGNLLANCLVYVSYFLFFVLPSWILSLVANIFNVIIALTLSSTMYTGEFIAKTWTVTRDLSNVFFILVLLYVAIQTILGIGHDTKKMIANVVIMALLINFSMFFTKVVIDTSNIIALIFYNKINVETIDKNGKVTERIYIPVLKSGSGITQDKDISGGLVGQFNPTKFLTPEFFTLIRERSGVVPQKIISGSTAAGLTASVASGAAIGSLVPIPGISTAVGAAVGGVAYILSWNNNPTVPPGIMFSIIITTGLILMFAIYAFFVASWAFLGRLIELWVLLIFSPFAFMSFVLPKLSGVPYVGWTQWISKLIKASFMAPIFMFFMYLIFRIVNANIWADVARVDAKDQGMLETMIFLILPALIILALLIQAAKFAKEGAGQVGEMAVGFGKAVTGLAIGGAFAGVGMAGRLTAGRFAATASRSEEAMKRGEALSKYKALPSAQRTGFDQYWQQYKNTNNLAFTPRTGVAGLVDKMGGVNLGARINAAQTKTGDVGHARHEWEDLKKKADAEGASDANLSGVTLTKMRDEFNKANEGNIEKFMRRGEDSKGKTLYYLDPQNNNAKTAVISEDKYKAANRQTFINNMIGTPQALAQAITDGDAETINGNTRLTGQGNRKVDDQLKEDYSTNYLKPIKKGVLDYKYHEIEHEKDATIGVGERVLSRSTGGTYDARNLANMAVKEGGSFTTKALTGLTLAVAAGIRAGLKKADVNTGTPQGSFLKDLGNTVTEAMKSAKVNVDVSHVTEEHKEDSHGGGGGGHH